MRKLLLFSFLASFILILLGYLLISCFLQNWTCYVLYLSVGTILFTIVSWFIVSLYTENELKFLSPIFDLLFKEKDFNSISGLSDKIKNRVNLFENGFSKMLFTFLMGFLGFLGISWTLFNPMNCYNYCKLEYRIGVILTDTSNKIRPLKMIKDSEVVLKLTEEVDRSNNSISGYIWLKRNALYAPVLIDGDKQKLTPDWKNCRIDPENIRLSNKTLHEFLENLVINNASQK